MEENQGGERRQSQRVDVSFWVEASGKAPLIARMIAGGNEIEASVLDLSEGGMAILSNFEIPPASIVSVKFSLLKDPGAPESGYKSVQVDAEVKYDLFVKEKSAFRVGLCFVDIPAPDKEVLSGFVKALLSSGRL